MQPDDDELAAWFRLLETPGLGREAARRLLAACGSPEAAVKAPRATLQRVLGAPLVDAIASLPPDFDRRLTALRRWRDGGGDRHVLLLGDAAFPQQLLQTADPPLLLYVQGRVDALAQRSVAMVGSRHATPQGRDNARALAAALGRAGWVVVSGLALGIDGAAHEGALDAAAEGGPGTVAVVGTGLDTVYPARHRDLARRIAENGALVSEFAPGTPALPGNFPQRNRIIAGLTQGTVVVEAALRSGSLITARLAVEAGRDVFAVPGSIHAPQSQGCHALIKQGAKLVETAADILDELDTGRPPPRSGRTPRSDATADTADADRRDRPLLQALGHDPASMDTLLARTGMTAAELNARLLDLELDGQVARLPGGLFQRRVRG